PTSVDNAHLEKKRNKTNNDLITNNIFIYQEVKVKVDTTIFKRQTLDWSEISKTKKINCMSSK
nr:hypothetical protein [Asgard group archaeon]